LFHEYQCGGSFIEHPAGVSTGCFDRRLKLKFHGSRIPFDAGLLVHRELDDLSGLTDLAGAVLNARFGGYPALVAAEFAVHRVTLG
jgi:hypothetical protein